MLWLLYAFYAGFNIYTPIAIPAWFINCNYIVKKKYMHRSPLKYFTAVILIILSQLMRVDPRVEGRSIRHRIPLELVSQLLMAIKRRKMFLCALYVKPFFVSKQIFVPSCVLSVSFPKLLYTHSSSFIILKPGP